MYLAYDLGVKGNLKSTPFTSAPSAGFRLLTVILLDNIDYSPSVNRQIQIPSLLHDNRGRRLERLRTLTVHRLHCGGNERNWGVIVVAQGAQSLRSPSIIEKQFSPFITSDTATELCRCGR